jgi:dTDP-4-dehydrorhamnose reductase
MRVFVSGANGQLARSLGARASASSDIVVGYGARPEVDLTRPETILPAMRAFEPDVVVNAAAYTAVDRAESEPELAHAVNCKGAAAMAAAAKVLAAPIIQLSTDYVFDGAKIGPYQENDRPAPQGVYGRTKLEGEIAVARANPRHVIARTSWVYAPLGANFVRTMIRLAGERDRLSVVDDQVGCPSYAPDVADAILTIARSWHEQGWRDEHAGVTHIAGVDALSWFEFAREIMNGLDARARRSAQVDPISSAMYPTPGKRPANSRLSTERLEALFGIRLPALQRSLGACLDQIVKLDSADPS